MVEWRVGGTTSVDVDAELRRRRESMSATLWSLSARYGGAIECRQRYVSTANLNSIRCGTGSQWRSRSSGLTGSCFLVEKTSRAAAFSTDWSRLSWLSGQAKVLLYSSHQSVLVAFFYKYKCTLVLPFLLLPWMRLRFIRHLSVCLWFNACCI